MANYHKMINSITIQNVAWHFLELKYL
ncbi:MAG: hypothetical protein RLZZ05_850, partial [Bacteroidota bacterium]